MSLKPNDLNGGQFAWKIIEPMMDLAANHMTDYLEAKGSPSIACVSWCLL
jgi:hypothetical protein